GVRNEDFHDPRPYRQWPHGPARIPARLRLESGSGAGIVRCALPPPPDRRAARLGHGIENRGASGRWPVGGGRREAVARWPAAHDVALWRAPRATAEILRRQFRRLQRPPFPPRQRDVRVLPVAENAERS